MKPTALIYRPHNPEPEVVMLDQIPDLTFLQAGVGGSIEIVPLWNTITWEGKTNPCVAFCNENGKIEGRVMNRPATQLWHQALPPPGLLRPNGSLADYLVGSILVIVADRNFLDRL